MEFPLEQPEPTPRITRREFLKRLIGLSGVGEKATLLDTARLSFWSFTAAIATVPAVLVIEEKTDLLIGNRGSDREREIEQTRDPAFNIIKSSLLHPLGEEAFFRKLPSALIPKNLGNFWKVGIPGSLVFAAAHNIATDSDGMRQMHYDTLPVYQFAFGALYWKLMRERGYMHAVLAHSIVNTLASIPGMSQPRTSEVVTINQPKALPSPTTGSPPVPAGLPY